MQICAANAHQGNFMSVHALAHMSVHVCSYVHKICVSICVRLYVCANMRLYMYAHMRNFNSRTFESKTEECAGIITSEPLKIAKYAQQGGVLYRFSH